MSSPVVNKDTLYFFFNNDEEAILCFYYGRVDGEDVWWSRRMRSYRTKGWEWSQECPFKGPPIGQRCILQW